MEKREENSYHEYLLYLQQEVPQSRFFLNARKFRDERGVWRNISLIPGSGDLIGVVQGRYVEVEVKTKKGRQSERQHFHQQAIEQCGGIYLLARTKEEAARRIQQAFAEAV